ncbi:MAG: AarF/ABC1/UbiB kinase family protein, partial [Pseudomonadota bacterium]
LDFGAAREVDQETIELYRQLLKAGLDGDRKKLKALSLQLSFYSEKTDMRHRQMIDRIVVYVFGAIRRDSHFDFASETLLEDVRSIGMELATDKSFNDIPSADFMFLQRKAVGLYLLGRRLGATIPLRDMLEAFVCDQVTQ